MPRTFRSFREAPAPCVTTLGRTAPARVAGRGVATLSALVLALGAVLWSAPAQAADPVGSTLGLPATTAAVNGHLLDVASSTRPISPWVSTDLTALESAAAVVGSVGVAQTAGNALVVVGRTAVGHLAVFISSGGAKSWTTGDLTVMGAAPLATGSPSVVVDPTGVIRVFFRSTTGHLNEIENDRDTTDPWFSSDLTALTAATHGASIAGDPTALSLPGYPTTVFARATGGALASFTLTDDPQHPWYFVDVSALANAPAIVGVPVAVPAPDGFGLIAVYAVTAAGVLVEFTDDDFGWHLWSARNVSSALSLPPVNSSPTAISGLPTVVTTVTTTGHLLAISIPTVSLVGAGVKDLSALVRQKVAPAHPVSIVATKVGYVVAADTSASHLAVFHVTTTTAATATVEDATMQPLTEQFVGSNPVAINLGGVTHVLLDSAGYLGMIPRILLTAESQDQFHAKIQDTPAGSNCNPYTASFGRGTTS
ncbi:MAG TPA: hypothetical protein VIE15_02280, partial [Acidimicrobiales bacterium]